VLALNPAAFAAATTTTDGTTAAAAAAASRAAVRVPVEATTTLATAPTLRLGAIKATPVATAGVEVVVTTSELAL
jgi:hypothetical protein